jgi:excisionase family DNA binding protein
MKEQHPQSTNATLSVDELAARWRVTPMTLRRWRKSGRLTAIQVGPRRLVFRVSDVEAFEAANQTNL